MPFHNSRLCRLSNAVLWRCSPQDLAQCTDQDRFTRAALPSDDCQAWLQGYPLLCHEGKIPVNPGKIIVVDVKKTCQWPAGCTHCQFRA